MIYLVVRPVDENGDFIPVYSLDQMLSGSDAVRQVVNLRLTFYSGEWWEDPEIGFLAPDFLVQSAMSGDVDMLGKYIAAYVANTEGVQSVEDVSATYSNHEMIFYCLVLTDDGDEEVVEVNVNGIL